MQLMLFCYSFNIKIKFDFSNEKLKNFCTIKKSRPLEFINDLLLIFEKSYCAD